MAHEIRISTQRLEQDKETIRGEISSITKEIEALAEEMQALGMTWEGPAWQIFQNQVAADIENMQAVCSKITGFTDHMEYACKEYKECENRVRSLVQNIRI